MNKEYAEFILYTFTVAILLGIINITFAFIWLGASMLLAWIMLKLNKNI